MLIKRAKKFNLKKILRLFANILFIFLIAIGLFIFATFLPIKNNFKLLNVMSGSMRPAIGVGSLIIIQPASKYKVGQVISFSNPDSKIKNESTTHRVVEIVDQNGEMFYRTKGDANESADSYLVPSNQIKGSYRFGIALLGYLMVYLKTLPGLILIIVIPATIIIYEEAKRIRSEVWKIRKRKKTGIVSRNSKNKKGEE